MPRPVLACLFLLMGLCALVAPHGCAAFKNPDGSLNQAKVQAAAEQGAATATGVGSLFGPLGTAIGGAIGIVALAYAAKMRGEATGYNQGSLDAGKPLPSAGSVKPTA